MKRAMLCAAALALAVAGTAPLAQQSYPSKPLRVLVPYGPGGVGDLTTRIVAQKMSESLGQPIVVENRPGAGLIPATEAALKADPDGYTFVLTGNGNALTVSLFNSVPYDVVNDLAHISTIGFFDLALLARADSKLKSVADVLAYARSSPGKMNIGTINPGSTQHLAAELFKSAADLRAETVPFKNSGAVVTALRAGDVDVAFEILAPVMAQLKSNTLVALAVTSDRRFAGLPNTPTLAESGVPGYQASSWNGFSISAKVPRAIVERLNKEVVAAVAAPDVRQKLLDLGVDARSSTPEQMRALMASDIAKWKTVIERAKIEKQ